MTSAFLLVLVLFLALSIITAVFVYRRKRRLARMVRPRRRDFAPLYLQAHRIYKAKIKRLFRQAKYIRQAMTGHGSDEHFMFLTLRQQRFAEMREATRLVEKHHLGQRLLAGLRLGL